MRFRLRDQTTRSLRKDKRDAPREDGNLWHAWHQDSRSEHPGHVYLPGSDIAVPQEESKTESMPMGKERILLVDDEELIVSAEQLMIERYLGYKVTALTSSVEALEVFRARPYQFDLVITDMIMPNMTGEILAKELKAIRPDIPVILCTGYSERIIKKDKAGERGEPVLKKPFDLFEIGVTIRKVLRT